MKYVVAVLVCYLAGGLADNTTDGGSCSAFQNCSSCVENNCTFSVLEKGIVLCTVNEPSKFEAKASTVGDCQKIGCFLYEDCPSCVSNNCTYLVLQGENSKCDSFNGSASEVVTPISTADQCDKMTGNTTTGNTTTETPPTTTTAPVTTPEATTIVPTTAPAETTTESHPTQPPTTTEASTTTSSTTTTTTTAKTTEAPTAEPAHDRRFDGPSFIGGIVLSLGIMAIGFVAWKFYKARTERNYHTL